MLTIKQAARDALGVQDACNLTGVLRSFMQCMESVTFESLEQGQGTEWRNNHPIVRLFVEKLASLAHMQGNEAYAHFAEAYAACQVLAGEGELG